MISVVDTDARHGHKSTARGFDGYKGHAAVDPDSEIITGAAAGPAGGGDAAMTEQLLGDLGADDDGEQRTDDNGRDSDDSRDGQDGGDGHVGAVAADEAVQRPTVYGDAAYGSGDNLARLERLGAEPLVKVQPANAPGGRFSKDDFDIDLANHTVTCPAGHTAAIPDRDADKVAVRFAEHCIDCPLRPQCTTAAAGRTITIGRHEQRLQAARARQQDPAWQADYRATRPKVERKVAHLLRRRHGGRRVRMRGLRRVDQDWKLLAGAVNLARLATLGVRWTP
ncbi:MAG TPA: transposase, partial [Euzebyales bacterium]|nr:transposase [Euzebyales bacterium]